MTPYTDARKSEFIPATYDTITYDDKTWGVPKQSDAAFMYYRTDQVDSVPGTWQEVYDVAAKNDGIVYQGAAYEGLTVDFLEIAFAAGGKVLSDDGKKAEFDSPKTSRRCSSWSTGSRTGRRGSRSRPTWRSSPGARSRLAAPRSCATGPTRTRSARPTRISKVRRRAAPGVRGRWQGRHRGPQPGRLGLQKNPGGALALIDYLTNKESITRDAVDYSLAPVLTSANVQRSGRSRRRCRSPKELEQAISQAKSRPVSPVYTQTHRRSKERQRGPERAAWRRKMPSRRARPDQTGARDV